MRVDTAKGKVLKIGPSRNFGRPLRIRGSSINSVQIVFAARATLIAEVTEFITIDASAHLGVPEIDRKRRRLLHHRPSHPSVVNLVLDNRPSGKLVWWIQTAESFHLAEFSVGTDSRDRDVRSTPCGVVEVGALVASGASMSCLAVLMPICFFESLGTHVILVDTPFAGIYPKDVVGSAAVSTVNRGKVRGRELLAARSILVKIVWNAAGGRLIGVVASPIVLIPVRVFTNWGRIDFACALRFTRKARPGTKS